MRSQAYVYWDNEGEPWAVIVDGHIPDRNFLARARAVAKANCIKIEGKIERRYMRHEDDSDQPWRFCKDSQRGAKPVTVIIEPPMVD